MKGNNAASGNESLSRIVLLLTFACVLLANPFWGLADILPDVVAWVLVWVALRRLAECNENLYQARKRTVWLVVVEVLKLVFWLLLRRSTLSSNRMLAVLLFCGAEAALLVLFFRSFLTGAEELSRAADCDKAYLKIENLRFLGTLFAIARSVCAFLPELTSIAELYIENPEDSFGRQMSEQTLNLLRQFASSREILLFVFSILEIAAAVAWLSSILPFLRLFRSDENLSGYLRANLSSGREVTRSERCLRAFYLARVCFAVGMVFLLDMRFNGVRAIPLFGFPLLFAFGCKFLDRLTDDRRFRPAWVAALCAAGLLLLAELYRTVFTVPDILVFAEQSLGTEAVSAAVILPCMASLFVFWLFFAGKLETVSGQFGCGSVYFAGLPYVLLTVYALLETAIFVLPLSAWYVNTVRVVVAVLFWFLVNRRLAALEEQIRETLLLAELPDGYRHP